MVGSFAARILPSAVGLLMSIGGASTALAKPAKFTLEVSPRRASIDDTFFATVIIEVDGVSGPERYWAPRFPGFRLIDSRTDQNASMRVDGKKGRVLVTQEIRRYQLKAKRPGNLFIEPARLRLGGIDYETRGAYVVVTPTRIDGADTAVADSTAPDPTAAGGIGAPGFVPPDPSIVGPIFMHAVVDKRSAFVGEQITVTWLLYTRKEVLKIEPKPATAQDTWAEILFEPKSFLKYYDTMVGRRPYTVVIVSKRAIFPTQAGRLRIPGFAADVVTLGAAMGRAERIRSRPVYVRVKALPKSAPDRFSSSYVGRFEVEAEADRAELAAGESLTLTVTVSGAGAVRRMEPPKLELTDFDVREPENVREDIDTSGNVVSGTRVYRYWMTPKKGGPQTIPAVTVPYFDPTSGEFSVARSRPIPLLVRGDPSQVGSGDVGSSRDNVITRDIRLIHEGNDVGSRILPNLYRQWWFVLVLLFPLLVYLGVIAVDRLLSRLRRETPRARLRRARGNAKRRFRLAEIHLRGNRPGKFFGELARVINEHLEERLGRPLQGLTREELISVLGDAGFARTTIDRVTKELDECDVARFSPGGSSRDEMQRAGERVRELLRNIERTRLATEAEEEEAA